jgi:putative integral membrane protein (TIGR02587 family)
MSWPVAEPEPGPWRRESIALARAFGGAFLFGVPLLFTMEMWWIGSYADLWKLGAFLLLAFLANVALAHFAGFRDDRVRGAALDQAVDAVAVGIVASIVVLLALNRVSLGDPLDSIVGMVVIQAVPLSIGASIANAVFRRGEGRLGHQDAPSADERHLWKEALNDLGATAAGGIFIGFSIAPTEEVIMLATELDYFHELALVGLSLVIAWVIVFASGFDPQARLDPPGPFQRPFTETAVSYAVSLLVAFVAL